jgi:hypothetical protein
LQAKKAQWMEPFLNTSGGAQMQLYPRQSPRRFDAITAESWLTELGRTIVSAAFLSK